MSGWTERAACRTEPKTTFFAPTKDGGVHARRGPWYQQAEELCAACPVAAECLADALATEPIPRLGFRAGMTPAERCAVAGEPHRKCGICDRPIPLHGTGRYCSKACRATASGERLVS